MSPCPQRFSQKTGGGFLTGGSSPPWQGTWRMGWFDDEALLLWGRRVLAPALSFGDLFFILWALFGPTTQVPNKSHTQSISFL